MKTEDIQSMIARGLLPDADELASLIQTHASWVILDGRYAYKIKKPVRFSFLDFSTAELREKYCREELRLNRRLAPEMYLDVLPVVVGRDGFYQITHDSGKPAADYAVWMNRMDEQRQMDLLLSKNLVSEEDMAPLAQLLATFHQKHRLPDMPPYQPGDYQQDFDDLFGLSPVLEKWLGKKAAARVTAMKTPLHAFLKAHEAQITQRARGGFWVDGHGDLHARNIFLLPTGPVVFDCIEFNAHFRLLDVLNELAFLCMDLQAKGHAELADAFMEYYIREWNCMASPEDIRLFHYFKAYRANVRLKIDLLQMEQAPEAQLQSDMARYLEVMLNECSQLAD